MHITSVLHCYCVQAQENAEPTEEKTEFTVRLVKYEENSKIKVIKEIKTLMEGMNLVQVYMANVLYDSKRSPFLHPLHFYTCLHWNYYWQNV